MTTMHHQALCALIEQALNELSKRSLTQELTLASLEGSSLSIQVKELSAPICFNFVSDKILVSSHLEQDADCSIYLQLSVLSQLKNTQNLTSLIKQEKLDVEGDLKVAQRFIGYLEGIDIDWRIEVANVIGDVATFKLEQCVAFLSQKFSFAREQISQDASEWLLHEKRLLVADSELQVHYEAVTACSKQTESIANRINALHAQIVGKESL
ncbi:ubiquinone biosynthesis accessory factor UbiJ [Thalassotalea fusca]